MNTITVGVIIKPHGVKGALKVKSDSDFKLDRFQEGAKLIVLNHPIYQTLTVTSFKEAIPLDILTVEEITNRDDAEHLRQCQLQIEASVRQPLEEDAYYFDQLEGLEVWLEDDLIGHVKVVENYPQGPMLRITREQQKDLLIPFRKAFVESVDLGTKKLTIIPWEGLL